MPDAPVTDRPRTLLLCACLIGAPLAETVEQALSPLTGGETVADLAAIAAAPGRFTVSIMIGLLGTALLLPALLGLTHRASDRSPRLALVAATCVVVSSLGFAGVRMAQGFELQLATGGLPLPQAAEQFDAAVGGPMGLTLTVAFLGGTAIGVILLCIALWRSRRVPIGAIVCLLIFPIVDLALPTGFGPVVSHLVLLVAFTWTAIGLLRRAPVRRVKSAAPMAQSATV